MPQAPPGEGRERPSGSAQPGRWPFGLRPPFGGSGADAAAGFDPRLAEDTGRLAALRGWLARQVDVEAAQRSGFHVLPVSLIVGAAAVFALDWRPNLVATAVAAVVFLILSLRASAMPTVRVLCLALAGVLAAALVSIIEARTTQTTIISGTATTRIAGRVLQASRDEKGRMRYLVAITGTVRPVLSRPPESARIMVTARHSAKVPGDPYYGLVRLGPPSGPAAPGSYDFAYQPFFAGVGALGFSLGKPDDGPAEGLVPPPDPGFFASLGIALQRVRAAMTERITQAAGGGEAGAIAAALVTGERAGISDDAETWLRGVGLAHVLSISGLHLAIVAGSALLILRCCLALIPALSLRYPVKKIAAIAALLVAALYLMLSGGNVATQRAFVMLAVMLAAVIADRPALTLRNVSIAALVVVLAAPHSVTTASFQMSFAATLALVAGYGAFMRHRGTGGPPVARPVVVKLAGLVATTILGIVASSIIAGAATAPFAAYHFHRVAPFGLVANVLTLPLFTLIVMPLGLVGSLLMPFGLDAWCFHLMGLSLEFVLLVSKWLYGVLPDRGTGPISGVGVAFLAAALFAASFFASQLRWSALPLALIGLLTIRDTGALPQLLVYEDGKTIAVIGADDAVSYLGARPKRFVTDQWERSFGLTPIPAKAGESGSPGTPAASTRLGPGCADDFCQFETRDGLKVSWTSDYERTGEACDGGDVAIVARAIRLTACRSGAVLVTLRTLRASGSLAFFRDPQTDRPVAIRSIVPDPPPWNRHRLAPWPEYWRKPAASPAGDIAAEPRIPATAKPEGR
ncbi:ComEC/Rec2 family competence protein [Jiella mangrovi]|uniref:ComEC/Rec2 family competence protein n=1 Tax=Jiella mangrovi TaxID=2821407 RepID=A0ABS4BG33_9HYPH|nr:ComEC/Rec2 family competence protein [Jiella mangrovi]MBP0615720.1 ComEC/Rec2 family competence protein [Jiella mangrovi]